MEQFEKLYERLEEFCSTYGLSMKTDLGFIFYGDQFKRLLFSDRTGRHVGVVVDMHNINERTKFDVIRKLRLDFKLGYKASDLKAQDLKEMINELYGLSKINYSNMYKKGSLFGMNKIEIKDVKFSGPCTIVFWSDGDKTVVRCGEDDSLDKEKGLAMAIAKKFMGTNKNKSNYCDIFKKWISEEDDFSKCMNPPESNKKSKKVLDDLYSVKLMAEKEGVSESAIHQRIKAGKYPGAYKNTDGFWMIPIYKEVK